MYLLEPFTTIWLWQFASDDNNWMKPSRRKFLKGKLTDYLGNLHTSVVSERGGADPSPGWQALPFLQRPSPWQRQGRVTGPLVCGPARPHRDFPCRLVDVANSNCRFPDCRNSWRDRLLFPLYSWVLWVFLQNLYRPYRIDCARRSLVYRSNSGGMQL